MGKIKYKIVKNINDKGFPTHPRKKYLTAHEEASKAEKKKFGEKSYDELKKLDEDLPNHHLIGKNFKNRKIDVCIDVPKPLRKEVAFHERYENDILLRKKKKKTAAKKKPPKKRAK